MNGVVVLWRPPRQLVATVDQLNNAFPPLDTRRVGDVGTPLIRLLTCGTAHQAVRDIEHEWKVSLHAVFSNQLA